jgi:hypothetical protein
MESYELVQVSFKGQYESVDSFYIDAGACPNPGVAGFAVLGIKGGVVVI